MQDKRKLKRRHLIYYLRVFDRNNDNLIGHLADIYSEGIMLVSERSVEPNTVFQLKMNLPKEILGREQMNFDAESLWFRKDINPNFYLIGFRFLKVTRNHFALIEELLDDFGFRD
jgi:hypothetical protein